MSTDKDVNATRDWAVIIANNSGRFWDYVKRKPYHLDKPYLFPNEPSAKGYAAWKQEWAKEHGYRDSVTFLPVNVRTTDMNALPLAWDTALNRVVIDPVRMHG